MFGAWLNGRATHRRAILTELNALNAAHALTFMVANKALALKRQYLTKMKSSYDEMTIAHDTFAATPTAPFKFEMDLRALGEITFPSGHLEKIVYEKLSLGSEGIAAAISLSSATDDLRESIKRRNSIVVEFQQATGEDINLRIAKYLGLVNADVVDERFRNNIEALSDQTDDCIFFAQRLGQIIVLREHSLRRRNRLLFLPGRKLVELNWKQAADDGLLPSETDYALWTQGFKKHPSVYARSKLFFQSLVDRIRAWMGWARSTL